MEAGYRVICPDMRGNGDSEKALSGYRGLSMVEDMRQMLPPLGITEKVHVGGWDMGALPACLFASTYHEEVASLTYIDEPLPSVNLHAFTTFAKYQMGDRGCNGKIPLGVSTVRCRTLYSGTVLLFNGDEREG